MSKTFDPKRLVPMLIKKYAEKNKRVRMETTEAFKHLLKVILKNKFLDFQNKRILRFANALFVISKF